MNVTEAVDQLIQFQENIHVSDGGYGNRTARTLLRLQQANDEIETFREWSWRITTFGGTVVTGDNSFPLPDDYASLGRSGKVFMRSATQNPWSELDQQAPEEVADLIDQQSSAVSFPDVFAIYSGKINFPALGTDYLYKIRYLKTPKTLVYGATPTPDTFDIPAAYHNTVVLAGAIVRMMRGKGDAREDWLRQYRSGITAMVARERDPESETRFMPEAVPPMC